MPPQQQQQQLEKITNEYTFGLLYLICMAHRATLLPFMRHTFGVNAFRPHGIASVMFLLMAAGAYPSFRLYFFLWLVVMIGQRIYSFHLDWKGVDCHSRYQGHPWLAMRWPGIKTEDQAAKVEPFFCLFAGAVLTTISEPLGTFVMAGFVSFFAVIAVDALVDWRRVQAMKDSAIEMRYYVDRYRG